MAIAVRGFFVSICYTSSLIERNILLFIINSFVGERAKLNRL